jgi:hypothetical protein
MMKIYTLAWMLFCAIALIVFLIDKRSYVLSQREYWISIVKPWKLATFLLAGISMMVMAHYTGDPTWDAYDAGFMSLFTYATAPWAVGSLYRIVIRRLPRRQLFVVSAVWMFTVSWSYDIYILARDGRYSPMWFSNIFASSLLYFLAGILWNLDWKKGTGIILSFREEKWPYVTREKVFGKLAWFALPVMALVAAMMLYFLL